MLAYSVKILKNLVTMELFSLNLNYWVLQTIAMLVTCFFIPKLKITHPVGAILMVVGIALLNTKVWSAALFFHIPDSLTTQTLSLFITNGLIFWVLVKLVPGIEVEGIFAALIAPVVFTVTSLLISRYGGQIDWASVFDYITKMLVSLRNYFQGTVPLETGSGT